jgi:hypothetical protein
VQNERGKECRRWAVFNYLDSYLTHNRPRAAEAATIPRVGGWDFVEVACRLSRKEWRSSVLPKPNPGILAQPLLPAFSGSLSAVVVFAHGVNRTAGLPFQTYNGRGWVGVGAKEDDRNKYMGLFQYIFLV